MKSIVKPIELEIKILEINEKDVIDKLIDLGAKKLMDTITYIKVFDISSIINLKKIPIKYHKIINEVIAITSNGKSLRDQNFHLRVRQQGNHFELTVKYANGINTKVKSEIEINVEISQLEFENIETILSVGGLKLIAQQQKKRISYKLNTLHFDIDKWPGIPTYLEIEGEAETDILKVIKTLDLDYDKISLLSGAKLFSEYGINFYSNLSF